MTDPTSPIGTLRLGFLLSSASGPVDSQPLKAKIENTTPRNRLSPSPKLPGLTGAKLKPPSPGEAMTLNASATMNTNVVSTVNDGASVAMPCNSIPESPTSLSCNSVLTVPSPVLPVSIATFHPFLLLFMAYPQPCTQLCL